MNANRLAVFDCDGTLVDSEANICLAIEDSFRLSGLEPPPHALARRVVGLSLVEAMQVLLPEGDAEIHVRLAEDYKSAFKRLRGQGLVAEPLFDGIADAIDEIGATGWLLGVATGKSDRGLTFCLEHHGLTRRFITRQTADRHPSKPHPSMLHQAMADAGAMPETTVMIGDTRYDIAMAKAAGVTAIGVAWGYHEQLELFEEGADVVVGHPRELVAWLEHHR